LGKRLDVLTVADLCVDLVCTGDVVPRFGQQEQLIDGYVLEVGGSATIFATQFAKLGGKVGIIGAVGDDPFGRFVSSKLRTIGIDIGRVRVDPIIQTGLSVALAKDDGDRAILTLLGSIDATKPHDLTDDLLADCRHWHIGGYFLLESLRPFWFGFLKRCRAVGVTTSLDTNWDPSNTWLEVRDLLPWVDVFLPNEREAIGIAGVPDVDDAGRKLSAETPIVVIKRGGDGATAFIGQGTHHAPAIPVERIEDTVGAGDNFDAGFLRAWLLGWDMPDCLALGSRCGHASLGVGGGIEGQLREDPPRKGFE